MGRGGQQFNYCNAFSLAKVCLLLQSIYFQNHSNNPAQYHMINQIWLQIIYYIKATLNKRLHSCYITALSQSYPVLNWPWSLATLWNPRLCLSWVVCIQSLTSLNYRTFAILEHWTLVKLHNSSLNINGSVIPIKSLVSVCCQLFLDVK